MGKLCPGVLGAPAGGGSTATWDAAWDDTTYTDLTGGNLIATFPTAGGAHIRSSVAASGKKVASVTITNNGGAGGEVCVGLCRTTVTQYGGVAPIAGVVSYFGNSYVAVDTTSQGAGWSTYTTSDRIDIAFDRTANLAWFGKNGTWVGDPVAGTGGIDISGVTGDLHFYAEGKAGAASTVATLDPNHAALGALSGFGEI